MYKRSLPKLLWYRLTQWAFGSFGRIYFRVSYRGENNIPRSGPAVILANHQSHLDPLLVGCYCRRPLGYLARASLFHGILGPLIRAYDAIPIDREGSALGGIRETLKRIKQGDAVLMFPEGTRTPDGKLQAIQPGFLALVRRGGAAIVPVAIAGAYEAMPRGMWFPRPRKIVVQVAEPISPELIAQKTDEELLELIRKQLHQHFEEAMKLAGR